MIPFGLFFGRRSLDNACQNRMLVLPPYVNAALDKFEAQGQIPKNSAAAGAKKADESKKV